MHLKSKNEPDQFAKERYDCPRKEGIKKTENYNKNCQVSSTNKDKQENHESRYEYVDDKKRVYEKGQNIVNRRKSLTITRYFIYIIYMHNRLTILNFKLDKWLYPAFGFLCVLYGQLIVYISGNPLRAMCWYCAVHKVPFFDGELSYFRD